MFPVKFLRLVIDTICISIRLRVDVLSGSL